MRKERKCTAEENIAYHEAGHFVFGMANLFGEPPYENVKSISIERKDAALGQVLDLTYYFEVWGDGVNAGFTKYPQHDEIKNDETEKKKMRKEAIKNIGGLIAEYIFCDVEPLNCEFDGRITLASDLYNFGKTVSTLYGIELHEIQELTDAKKEFWDLGLKFAEEKKGLKEAIKLVMKKLIESKTIKGDELKKLESEVRQMMAEI